MTHCTERSPPVHRVSTGHGELNLELESQPVCVCVVVMSECVCVYLCEFVRV